MASRMLLGRNVCRFFSSRAMSSHPRGGIPMAARCYCSSVPPSKAEGSVDTFLLFCFGITAFGTSKDLWDYYWRKAAKETTDAAEETTKADSL